MRHKITVIMAAYEGEDYIGQQIDSVLSQTVWDLQLIISDDGSGDNTRKILEQYKAWYPESIFLNHRIKEGQYADRAGQVPPAAMNFFWLLSKAEGDYILLCDQDDVWRNDKVRKLLGRMKSKEKQYGKDFPVLVYSDMEVVDQDLYPVASSFFSYQHCNPKRRTFSEILAENPVTGGAVMINRALAGLVDKVPKACCMHDWWIALAASCFGVISCVREPLYQYRQHEDNALGARRTGSPKDLKERLERQRQVEQNYRNMFAQARAFGSMYGKRMTEDQKHILRAFLALPYQTPAGRLCNIVRSRFFKSSRIQTLAQCFTIPSAGERGKPWD